MKEALEAPKAGAWSLALAIVGGLAWGASHGIETRPALAFVALAPLVTLLGARRPTLLGWLHGIVAWCAAIPWIVPTLTTYGRIDGWLAGLALLLLAAFLGLYDALFGGLGARLWRGGDPLSLAALPALWVALEVLRGWALSGFPWNLAAYAWVDLPGALELSSWTGAWGVSYLVVLVNVCVARAVARRRWQPAVLGILLPAALLPIAARFAPVADPAADRAAVAVVQPNIPNRPFFDAAASEADYQRLLGRTRPACRPGTLVVWPESAAWPRGWQDDLRLRLDVREILATGGCSLLLNSAHVEGGKTFNSLLLIVAGSADSAAESSLVGGPQAGSEGLSLSRADKRHLVPFGEYVPLRRVLPFLGTIARMAGDFSPASGIRLLPWGDQRLGAAVCYEVVFPGETAALVRAGATALVTVTNDAWYGDTAAPRQHLRAARFRAAENRRWLLRAAITGISAVVRPDGSLAARADVGEEATLRSAIVGRSDRSPYSRVPWATPALFVALAGLALVRARRD